MKLWLLKPKEGLPNNVYGAPKQDPKLNPWDPWYDKAFGFVVAAESEIGARRIAHDNGGDENHGISAWLDPSLSTCVELVVPKQAGMILRDLASA